MTAVISWKVTPWTTPDSCATIQKSLFYAQAGFTVWLLTMD